MAGFQSMKASFNFMMATDCRVSHELPEFAHPLKRVSPISGLVATVQISPELIAPLPKEIQKTLSEMFQGWVAADHAEAIRRVAMCLAKEISRTELRQQFRLTYKNWDDMKQRCKVSPNAGKHAPQLHPLFNRFLDFLAIMGPRPYESWSLDRLKPRGPYSPDNLRWADKKTQSRNRTNTIYLVDANGVRRSLVEWAEVLGVAPGTLRSRRAAGWSDEEIICGNRNFGPKLASNTNGGARRDPFIYTPWPYELREVLERSYQRNALSGEHRLSFMKRYSAMRMSEISERAFDLWWPDDYEPSETELILSDALGRKYDQWRKVYRDALNKLEGKAYRHFPYGRVTLPNWVEQVLHMRFGGG